VCKSEGGLETTSAACTSEVVSVNNSNIEELTVTNNFMAFCFD
jgi:hypothetical protein